MEGKIDKLLVGVSEILDALRDLPDQITSMKPKIQLNTSFNDDVDDDLDFHAKGYNIEDSIGIGNNPVYKVKDIRTGELFALKCIGLDDEEVTPEVAKELSLLFDVKHEHIVRLKRAFIKGRYLCLMMELAHCDLNEFTILKQHISPEDVRKWMKQLISALVYLHNRNIIHRDLKLENVLMSVDGIIKLADFGLARTLFEGAQLTPRVTTLEYRAPELLLGCETYTPAIDMWSVGCIFWGMIMSKPIFECKDSSEEKMIEEMFKKLGAPNESSWPGVTMLPNFPKETTPLNAAAKALEVETQINATGMDLLMRLLCYDPEKRITAEDALKHPYFLLSPKKERLEYV